MRTQIGRSGNDSQAIPDAEERSLHIVGYIRTAESHCGEALPTVDPQLDLLNVNNQPKNVCNLAQSDDIVFVFIEAQNK